MGNTLDIGIVGCGIGGLAAGAMLAQAGHNITIFDKFDKPGPVGSGLVIQPVGLRVLAAVGAAEFTLQKGAKINQMSGHDVGTGLKVLDVSYRGEFGLAIHRASLFEALFRAANRAGCGVVTSATITETSLQEGKRLVAGRAFDLVIDASGAGSTLSPNRVKPLAYGALWGTVGWPSATSLPHNQLSQKYRGAKNMVGVLPSGALPGETTQKATFFWSLRKREFANWQATPLESWKAEVLALWPEMQPFLAQITRREDLTKASYSHGALKKPYAERLVFIGDAAHSASPQLGQGANMALLDAQALAQSLARLPLEHALPDYAASRKWHIAVYQFLSAVFTPMYQSDSRVLPFLRNWLFTPLTRIPPAPRLLTKIVTGELLPPIRR